MSGSKKEDHDHFDGFDTSAIWTCVTVMRLLPATSSEPRADSAKPCDRAAQQRSQLSVVPSVPGSPPLELGVQQRFVHLYFAACASQCCQRGEHMRPYLILKFVAGESKRQFVQRVARAGQDLNLSKGAAVLNVGTERYPAGFRMPGRRHQRERLGAGVQHHYAGGDRAARGLGIDAQARWA